MCNDYEQHVRWVEYCKMMQALELAIPNHQSEADLPQADDVRINDTGPVMRAAGSEIELAAARSLKIALIFAPIHSDVEIETAIIAFGREPRSGLVGAPDLFIPCIACRLYWRRRKTTYRRSIGTLTLPETAA
jgi:hypothetical protein